MSSSNLDSKLQTQEIYLDSQYATINTSATRNSDVYFFLSTPITVATDHDIVMRVDNFVCPISFSVVNDTNNTLVVNASTFLIPEGNYNALTLTTALNTLLTPLSITTTYDGTTNKLTFTRASSFTFQSSSTCFKVLGFEQGIAHASVLDSLTSEYVVNLSGTSLIYVDIPTVSTRNVSSRNGGAFTTIVKSIVADVPYGAILSYTNNTNSAVVLKEKYLSYFQIRLLDDEYNLLDLNGQHFTLTLELFFYYNGQSPLVGDNLADAVRQQEQIKKSLLDKR